MLIAMIVVRGPRRLAICTNDTDNAFMAEPPETVAVTQQLAKT